MHKIILSFIFIYPVHVLDKSTLHRLLSNTFNNNAIIPLDTIGGHIILHQIFNDSVIKMQKNVNNKLERKSKMYSKHLETKEINVIYQ